MLRAIRHNPMRLTTQSYKSPFLQLRYMHQHGSKVLRNKNESISETVEYAQKAPVNINHFKALVEPPNASYRKRYRFRWDWHLRNFLMALMPPGALLISLKFVEWRFSDDMDKYGHLFPEAGDLKQKLEKSLPNLGAAEVSEEDRSKRNLKASVNEMLLERMEKLEKEIESLRAQQAFADAKSSKQAKGDEDDSQEALIRARKISKAIVRQKGDLG